VVRAVREHALPGPVDRWQALRDLIHTEVCQRAFDPVHGHFTQFYGDNGLDASLLLIPRVGFLPGRDPRLLATIEAIQRDLTEGRSRAVYRTDESDDGLSRP